MDPHRIVDHVPALRRYARLLTGDAWAADDLVQDAVASGPMPAPVIERHNQLATSLAETAKRVA